MPDDTTQQLLDAIRENFTPEGVALIAAKLRPAYAAGEAGREAEAQCQWLADRLLEMLGHREYAELCQELGL